MWKSFFKFFVLINIQDCTNTIRHITTESTYYNVRQIKLRAAPALTFERVMLLKQLLPFMKGQLSNLQQAISSFAITDEQIQT